MKLIIKYTDLFDDEEFVDLYNVDSPTDADEIILDFERSKKEEFIVILGHVTLTEEQFQIIVNQGRENITYLN